MVSADTQIILNAVYNGVNQTVSTILGRIAASDQQLIGVINTGNSILLNNTASLLNSAVNQISTRLAAYNAQLISIQSSYTQQILSQIQASNQLIAGLEQVTQSRILQAVTALNQQTLGAIQLANAKTLSLVKGTSEQTAAIVQDTGERVVSKVIEVQNKLNTDGGGIDLNKLFGIDVINNIITEVFKVLFDIDISQQQTHSGILEDALQPFVDSVHEQATKIKQVFLDVSNGKYTKLDDVLTAFTDVGVNHTLLDIAIFLSQAIPSVLRIGNITTAPFFTRLEQSAKAQYGLTQIDANTAMDLYRRHWIDERELANYLKRLGYNDNDIQLLIAGSHAPSTFEATRALYYRGFYSRKQAIDSVSVIPAGLDDKRAFEQTLDQIPPMADLVSMAVREAFSPDIANRFGQYEDYPTQLTQFAKAQGFTEEWSKRYWASHWDLPSPQQGFEMLHRGLIGDNDLTLLLRALDVMPYWRDKLKGITYALPTRVDIRRMYSEDIINYQEVLQAYKSLGYDNTWAKRLADFAVKYDDEQDIKKQGHIKDLTYGTIEAAYKRRIIQRNEAIAKLQLLKYSSKDIDILLSLWDYQEYVRTHPDRTTDEYDKLADITLAAYKRRVLDRIEAITYLTQSGYSKDQATKALAVADIEYAVAFKADVVNSIQKQYMEGIIDGLGVRQALNIVGFSTQEIEQILQNFVIIRNLQKNRPTKAELKGMVKKGIISRDDYRDQLRAMNYDDVWIEPLLLYDLGEEE